VQQMEPAWSPRDLAEHVGCVAGSRPRAFQLPLFGRQTCATVSEKPWTCFTNPTTSVPEARPRPSALPARAGFITGGPPVGAATSLWSMNRSINYVRHWRGAARSVRARLFRVESRFRAVPPPPRMTTSRRRSPLFPRPAGAAPIKYGGSDDPTARHRDGPIRSCSSERRPHLTRVAAARRHPNAGRSRFCSATLRLAALSARTRIR